jgi:hypothetical protein
MSKNDKINDKLDSNNAILAQFFLYFSTRKQEHLILRSKKTIELIMNIMNDLISRAVKI